MNPEFFIALVQAEQRARIAEADRYRRQRGVARERRARVRRAWTKPRLGRRPHVVVAPA